MSHSPCATRALCDTLYGAARHLHGLTKTARPVLLAAADGQVQALPARARRIAKLAVDMVGTGAEAPVGEEGIAARIAALLRVGRALAGQNLAFLGVADDGANAHLVASGRPRDPDALAESVAFWNRLAPRPLAMAPVPEGIGLTCRLLGGDVPAAEAVRRTLQCQMEQFNSRSYGLVCDWDIEFVHEMRVATRRMRAALRTFRKAFEPPPEGLKAHLKSLAAELGVVRDLDVFLAFLAEYLAGNDSVFGRALLRGARRTRRDAYRRLVADHAPLQSYDACCRPPGAEGALVPLNDWGAETIAARAPRLLHKALKRLKQQRGRLGRLSPEGQHRLRIDCKRLRYTGEFLADIYPRELSELVIEPARAIQDALGEVHDCDVFAGRVADGCRRARAVQGDALEALYAHLKSRRTTYLRRAAARWRVFHSRKHQARVADLIRSPLRD